MEKDKVFIAVYTNKVKSYCDEKFFNNLKNLSYNNQELYLVDNSEDFQYVDRLAEISSCKTIDRIQIDLDPKDTLFLRRVTGSVNYLRSEFLKTDSKYFIIIESDVLVPSNLIEQLLISIEEIEKEEEKPWGVIGGLYYKGFHDYSLVGIQKTHHVLSGVTLYKREVIEKYPFRWSHDNLGAFPDAWICFDVNKDGDYLLYNDHRITCEHLHDSTGRRGHQYL